MWATLVMPFALLALVLCLATVERHLFPGPAEHESEEREHARAPSDVGQATPGYPGVRIPLAHRGPARRARARRRGHGSFAPVRALRHHGTRRPATHG